MPYINVDALAEIKRLRDALKDTYWQWHDMPVPPDVEDEQEYQHETEDEQEYRLIYNAMGELLALANGARLDKLHLTLCGTWKP
jgi:hypothetical protein